MAATRWHADGYSYRAAITVPTASLTADSLIWDPAAWFDPFWDNVLPTGYDVRFYDALGTLLQHERATWTYASRSASFEVAYADVSAAATNSELIWAYWGNASATDASAATPTVSSVVASMRIIDPTTQANNRVVVALPEAPGNETPSQRISKTTWEQIMVWWDITDLLGDTGLTSYDRPLPNYSLGYVYFDTSAGTGLYTGGTRDDATAPDIVQGSTSINEANGRTYVGVWLTGGTVDTDHVLSLRIALLPTDPIVTWSTPLIEARALVQVRNPDEA
jgi:hypothetical protein